MTARISWNLRRTGGHRPPLQSEHFLPVTVVVCQREVRMRSNLVRHFIRVTAMLALPLSGYVQNAPSQSTTNPQVVEGKGMYWSIDDVKKALSAGAPVPLPRTPTYVLTVQN